MALRVLPPDAHRPMPWANGRGVTTELVRRDTDGGRLLFRLSVASVTEPGPFSAFPGVDRQLVLIEGEGFDLSVDGARVAVAPFAPVAFPGEADVAATDLRGPSRDFNLMTGRGLATGTLRIARTACRMEADRFSYGFAVRGSFAVDGIALRPGSLLAVEDEPGRSLDISGTGLMILARIRLAPDGGEDSQGASPP